MRIESQAPIIGVAFAGGMAQSYLIKQYPQWSWILSGLLIGGGVYLGTRPGWQETIGLGLAASGASGLGTALIPTGTKAAFEGGVVRRQLGTGLGARMLQAGQAQREALGLEAGPGVGSRYPAPRQEEEFSSVRLT